MQQLLPQTLHSCRLIVIFYPSH